MKPSSPLNKPSTLDDITTKTSPSQLNLCTYTVSSNLIKEFFDDVLCTYLTYCAYLTYLYTYSQAGEDQGRLASLAKEFGLAKGRRQKRQIRKKHTFKVILVLRLYFVFYDIVYETLTILLCNSRSLGIQALSI